LLWGPGEGKGAPLAPGQNLAEVAVWNLEDRIVMGGGERPPRRRGSFPEETLAAEAALVLDDAPKTTEIDALLMGYDTLRTTHPACVALSPADAHEAVRADCELASRYLAKDLTVTPLVDQVQLDMLLTADALQPVEPLNLGGGGDVPVADSGGATAPLLDHAAQELAAVAKVRGSGLLREPYTMVIAVVRLALDVLAADATNPIPDRLAEFSGRWHRIEAEDATVEAHVLAGDLVAALDAEQAGHARVTTLLYDILADAAAVAYNMDRDDSRLDAVGFPEAVRTTLGKLRETAGAIVVLQAPLTRDLDALAVACAGVARECREADESVEMAEMGYFDAMAETGARRAAVARDGSGLAAILTADLDLRRSEATATTVYRKAVARGTNRQRTLVGIDNRIKTMRSRHEEARTVLTGVIACAHKLEMLLDAVGRTVKAALTARAEELVPPGGFVISSWRHERALLLLANTIAGTAAPRAWRRVCAMADARDAHTETVVRLAKEMRAAYELKNTNRMAELRGMKAEAQVALQAATADLTAAIMAFTDWAHSVRYAETRTRLSHAYSVSLDVLGPDAVAELLPVTEDSAA